MAKKRQKQVQFAHFTDEERPHVDAIVTRAVEAFAKFGVHVTRIHMRMNLSAAHAVCPLDLARLAAADNFNFTHDIGGIEKHLNKTTGEIEDCFVPRFARREAVRS